MRINFNETFFMGLFLIGLAFYFFSPVFFTPRNALIEKNGQLDKVEVKYNVVESARGGRSIKCELTIFLQNDKTKYSIFENIGQAKYYLEFERIKNRLKPNRAVKILIGEIKASNTEPNVFQITDDKNEILYSIKDAKSLSKFGFIGLFSLGLIFILLSIKKNPRK